MPVLPRLRVFLELHGVRYTHTVHPVAYTAREVAELERVPLEEMAKVIIIAAEGEYRMVVLPASRVIDFPGVRAALDSPNASLATEAELRRIFPDCELGAMPPFGNLYHMKVLMDSMLLAGPRFAFNAGTHRDLVHMSVEDFCGLVRPEIVSFGREAVMR